MTVVFTDMVGFTALSERLGEKIVPLLNEFMSLMVPLIRERHHGYVNKFLGDGIMFFFGAPKPNHMHAVDAVASVLDMHVALEELNRRLDQRGLPRIGMRAGISSGEMVVGNAGSAESADYTVLGDMVNLGARLESANKLVGTSTLITSRTAELLNGEFRHPAGRTARRGWENRRGHGSNRWRAKHATDLQKRQAELCADERGIHQR